MKRFSLAVALLLTAFVALGAAAAEEVQKPALLDRAATLAAAAEVTAAAYPDADDALVDDRIRVRYEADGTAVTFDETWVKVLTEKGRRDSQNLPFEYNQAYGDVSLDVLEVVRPDGSAAPVDVAAQSRVMTESGQMGSNIYDPNNKVLQVGVPGLAVGDLVHYRAIHRTTKARVPNTWNDYNTFEGTSPILHMTYEVSGPKELPLRSLALKDEVPGTVTFSKSEEGARLVYRWEVRRVPRMYEEPDMPPLYTCVQRLLVSTNADWQEISRWYWKISLPHYEPTDAMKAMVADLTRGVGDRPGKVRALFDFVAQKVRYMGVTLEKEAPGFEPHDVRITFDNKYGVCRDKAALLVEMLRLAGIEAFPVLIQVGPKKDATVPQPYFNHAVAAARNPDGTYELMDPTDENSRELLPAYLSDMSYLVATPEGDALRTSPIVPATENLMRIETKGRLSAAGDLAAESVLHFDGINDNAYRDYFARIQPEERRAYFEGLARRVTAGARLSDVEILPANLTDLSVPLTARLRFEAQGVPVTNGKMLLLALPRFGARVGMVNLLLGSAGLEKRKYPYVTHVACGLRESVEVEAPSLGKTLALPRYEPVETDAVSFAQSLAREGGKLLGSETFLMKVVEFSPAQYAALKGALRTMEYDERQRAIFAAAQPPPDATMLSDDTVYDLASATAWTETRAVRVQVLTYAGKRRYSTVQLAYNPVWEEVAVERAAVTGPDGVVHEVKKEEQNLMDAAWAGGAPRYPAAKTLVLSLPGVEVGSVIEYRVRRTCRDRPFFAARASFRALDPADARSLTVEFPAALSLNVRACFDESLRYAEEPLGERVRRRWSASGLAGIQPETQLPPAWAYVPTVCLSTGEWKRYAGELDRALRAAAAGQAEAERKAKELVAGLSDKKARLLAIRDFVARQIRDAGPGLDELPLSAITPADRTLQEGYGNAADEAVLLFSMLRAAGFRPAFVAASRAPVVGGMRNPLTDCPAASDFDSVLVRAPLDGRDVYLNDTDEYASLGSTSHDGRYGLDLEKGRVFGIQALPDMSDRTESSYRLELQPDGDTVIRRTVRTYGMEYAGARKKFTEMVPEARRRYFQEAVSAIAQGAAAEGELVTNFDGYPGVEEFTVRVPRYAVRDGKYLYLTLPATLRDFFAFRSETRENPLYWPAPRRAVLRTVISLPPGFDALALKPEPLEWVAPQGAGRVRLETAERPEAAGEHSAECRIEESADLLPALIPAADYAALLRAQRLLSHPNARTVLLTEK